MSNFIYRKPPEGPDDKPRLRQSAEKPPEKAKDLSDSPENLLKQLQLLQEEYDRIKSRADTLGRKISEAQTLISKLGKDSAAGKMLTLAIDKFRSTKDEINSAAYLKAIQEAIYETRIKIYQKTLLKAGLAKYGASDVATIKELFRLENDPRKIVLLYKEMKGLIGDTSIQNLISPLKIYGGAGPVLEIITELQKLKVSKDDIISFYYMRTKLTIGKIKDMVTTFQTNGIRENLVRCYYIAVDYNIAPAKIAPYIAKLKAAGINNIYQWDKIFKIYKNNLADINQFLEFKLRHQGTLAKAGLKDYEIIDFILSTHLNSNAVAQLPKLIEYGFSPQQATFLIENKYDFKEIRLLRQLVKGGIEFSEATEWLKVEQDPDKIIAYVKRCGTFPGITIPYFELYTIISDPNRLTQKLIENANELVEKTGISKHKAFYAAYMDQYPACSTPHPDLSCFERYWPALKRLNLTPDYAMVIWALARTNNNNPSQIELENIIKYLENIREFTDADFRKLPQFIIACQKINSPIVTTVYDIIEFWSGNWQMPPSEIAPTLTYLQTHKFPLPKSVNCAWALYKTTCSREERIPLAMYVLNNAEYFDSTGIELFFKDPAMPYCEALIKIGIEPHNALIYGRNLWFAKVPLTTVAAMKKEDLIREKARVAASQEKIKDISLFRGRDVVCLKEMGIYNGIDRFMTAEMQRAIRISMGIEGVKEPGTKLDVYATGNYLDSQKKRETIGKKFLEAIVRSKPPTTFIADCHGSPDGFQQFGISTKNLADAFKKRAETWKSTPFKDKLAEDIIISKSCYFHTAARAVIEGLGNSSTAPIFIAGNEYGSYGFTNPAKENFMFKVLQAGSKDPQVRDVILAEGQFRYSSDVSIYTYDILNRPMQVTKTDHDKKPTS